MSHPFIIDDSTPESALLHPEYGWQFGRGLVSAPKIFGRAYGDVAESFPDSLLIPRSEWQARIEERKARTCRLRDVVDQAGLPCKDQNGTQYCWVNATTHCLEITRVLQNEPMVILSPASAGAQIKNYWNVGGSGPEALDWIVKNGVVPVDQWPANAIDRRYATPANQQLALKYRVTEWWELDTTRIDPIVSVLLRGIPVSVGLEWWMHQVTYYDADWIDGDIAILFRNSWGDWKDHGYAYLQGWKMIPINAVCPRVAIAC